MIFNAPGKHERQGLSLLQVTSMFPDDATAEAWFVKTRWANGIACPRCGSLGVYERPSRKPLPYRCRDCKKYFSVKTGTPMQGIEPRPPHLGDCVLPDGDRNQRDRKHEAAPGSWDHSKNRLASGPPDSGIMDKHQGSSLAPSKSMRRISAASARICRSTSANL